MISVPPKFRIIKRASFRHAALTLLVGGVVLGAWSIGLTLLVANNPELNRLAQTGVFQLEQTAHDAAARDHLPVNISFRMDFSAEIADRLGLDDV